jgi:hypothetical protein
MEKLVRAYKDVFGSAGPGSERSDEEIMDILEGSSVSTREGARVIARKELSGQMNFETTEPTTQARRGRRGPEPERDNGRDDAGRQESGRQDTGRQDTGRQDTGRDAGRGPGR